VAGLVPGGCQDKGDNDNERAAARPRLVTFSPALTSMVFDMGLGDHVVGVSSYCKLPQGQQRPGGGSVLSVRAEPILAARPDVILAHMKKKHFDTITRINPEIRIEYFNFEKLLDIAEAMERIGQIVNHPEKGAQAKKQFFKKLEHAKALAKSLPTKRVLFVTGYKNPLGAGKDTFIHEMIELAGGVNVLGESFSGWKKPSLETIMKLSPEIIICQCSSNHQVQAVEYWHKLLGQDIQVQAVTNSNWTIPAGHLAEYTIQLAQTLHADKSRKLR